MTALADLVRESRERKRTKDGKRWTQDDLAEATGFSRGYIGQLETGLVKNPRPKYRKKFQEVLGITDEQWARGIGVLGEVSTFDVEAELRRIDAIPDLEDQAAELEALEQAPPELYRLMESVALNHVRRMFRSGRE
jgi:transcriptional regulator with XRE-family HTH domain